MNTIKTLVVVTTLLAVGYGAHVVLNKPIPNGQFAQDAAFPKLPGFDRPSLKMDSEGDDLSVTLPPSQSLDAPPRSRFGRADASLPPLVGQNTPSSNRFATSAANTTDKESPEFPAPLAPGQTPSTPGQAMNQIVNGAAQQAANVTNRSASQVSQPVTPHGGSAGEAMSQFATSANQTIDNLQGASQQMAQAAAQTLSNTVNQAGATIDQAAGNLHDGVQDQTQQIATVISGVGPAGQMTSATSSRHYGSSGRFEEVWFTAQSKLQNGQLVDALLTMSMFFNDTSLTDQQRDQLVPLLDQLAGSVVYSNSVHIEAPYEVLPGETIESVAQSYGVTPSFIMRTNALSSPILQPGQQIKVVRGPFRGELSLARRELTLFAGRYYAGRFPVAIGRDLPTQASVLEVIEIAGPRPYLDPRTGEQIAPGDPRNPYGNLWIGLRDSGGPEFANLGLHASGAGVEASDSRGCISLSDSDVDDLQAILTIGSRIQIVP